MSTASPRRRARSGRNCAMHLSSCARRLTAHLQQKRKSCGACLPQNGCGQTLFRRHPNAPTARSRTKARQRHASRKQRRAWQKKPAEHAIFDKEKAAQNGSSYDYTKSFAQQIDDWIAGKIPKNDSLLVGKTPEVFQKIGFNALPMTINQTHVDYAINGTKNTDHTIGADGLK